MSDKVGTNESQSPTSKISQLSDLLLEHHQIATNQVMHDKNIIEALKPNLLGLIGANSNKNNINLANEMDLQQFLAAKSSASFATSNSSNFLSNSINQQQQLAALDIFAYCQYISSMMLFKAMSQNDTNLLMTATNNNNNSINNSLINSGPNHEKRSTPSTSPNFFLKNDPTHTHMPKSKLKKSIDLSLKALPSFDSSSPTTRSLMSLRNSDSKPNGRSETKNHKQNDFCNSMANNNTNGNNCGRKFISNERRPRQAYNTKQLERLESEFQVSSN